jgi:hypothetical protein
VQSVGSSRISHRSDRRRIGSVDDFLFSDDNWVVRWAVIDTGNWLPMVSLRAGARSSGPRSPSGGNRRQRTPAHHDWSDRRNAGCESGRCGLSRRRRTNPPGVPFIFIIGYCDEQLIRDFGDRPTLPKPFRRLDLNASCRCHSPRSRRALNLFARGYIGATELKFGPRRAPALSRSKPSVAE